MKPMESIQHIAQLGQRFIERKPIIIAVNIIVWVAIFIILHNTLQHNISDTEFMMLAGGLYGSLIGFNAYAIIPSFSLVRFALMSALWSIGFMNLFLLSSTLFFPTFILIAIGSTYILRHRELIRRQIIGIIVPMCLTPYICIGIPPIMNIDGSSLSTFIIMGIILGLIHGSVFIAEYETTIDIETVSTEGKDKKRQTNKSLTIPDTDLFYDDDQEQRRQSR